MVCFPTHGFLNNAIPVYVWFKWTVSCPFKTKQNNNDKNKAIVLTKFEHKGLWYDQMPLSCLLKKQNSRVKRNNNDKKKVVFVSPQKKRYPLPFGKNVLFLRQPRGQRIKEMEKKAFGSIKRVMLSFHQTKQRTTGFAVIWQRRLSFHQQKEKRLSL